MHPSVPAAGSLGSRGPQARALPWRRGRVRAAHRRSAPGAWPLLPVCPRVSSCLGSCASLSSSRGPPLCQAKTHADGLPLTRPPANLHVLVRPHSQAPGGGLGHLWGDTAVSLTVTQVLAEA